MGRETGLALQIEKGNTTAPAASTRTVTANVAAPAPFARQRETMSTADMYSLSPDELLNSKWKPEAFLSIETSP